eukprot:m.582246 g.582246  ORF g.582246 m.582246 type:complete len:164 (+) comp22336_c0_seq17:1326-1817(+)
MCCHVRCAYCLDDLNGGANTLMKLRNPKKDHDTLIAARKNEFKGGFKDSPHRYELGFQVTNMFDAEAGAAMPTSFHTTEVQDDGTEVTLITDYHTALAAYRRFVTKEHVSKRQRLQRMATGDTEVSSGSRRTNTLEPSGRVHVCVCICVSVCVCVRLFAERLC